MISIPEQGRVKFYNDEHGFGFIRTESGDVFMHITEMPYTGSIQKGDLVEFCRAKTRKGWVAKKVALVERAEKLANDNRTLGGATCGK